MLDMAQKIRTKRISLEYTQKTFSDKSGVSLSTYRIFEQSGKGSFENFIAILSALGSVSELESLVSKTPFSPAKAFYEKTTKERLRVKNKTSKMMTLSTKPNKKESTLLEAIKAKNAKK
ncbi:MAG: hypothetical protein DRQ78_03625 [Epsilonproteobacteria bacterium]|nr:MAG: hypothetical protein DRQ78_03625 [Campylobacterota bacterium]